MGRDESIFTIQDIVCFLHSFTFKVEDGKYVWKLSNYLLWNANKIELKTPKIFHFYAV